MQVDPNTMAKDMYALASLASYEVGSEDWLDAAAAVLDEIYGRVELSEEIGELPLEETIEERIARKLGLDAPAQEQILQPSPPLVRSPPEQLSPSLGGVQHNVIQKAALKDLQRRMDAGETINRAPTPPLNMAARSAGAATAPALLDAGGNPILSPGGGMV